MYFELKPDYDICKKRIEAFWNRELIDRPPMNIVLGAPNRRPVPKKTYDTYEEMWLDVDFRAERMAAETMNHIYYADAMPVIFPNMGPEIFSAWCGCGYEYGEETTWSTPCIFDWEKDYDKAVLNENHPLLKKQIQLTKNLLELGNGKFITGFTDFHAGGDHVAALRDPQVFAVDLLENPDWVKRKLVDSNKEFHKMYDYFYEMHKAAGIPMSAWISLVDDGKYYVVQNDFSYMISKDMFDEFFLEGIIDDCKFLDRSIYHLDGQGALRHLDSLLAIKELDAVQWVPGAGNEGYSKWVWVYQKIQKAGKGIELMCHIDDLDLIFETLRPEGVWFSVLDGIGGDREIADRVIKRITAWR